MLKLLRVFAGFTILMELFACSGSKDEAESSNQTAAAPVAVQPIQPNAADEYARLSGQLGDALMDQLSGVSGWGSVDAGAARILQANQSSIDQLLQATRMEHCDFNVNLNLLHATLPHAVYIRRYVRILNADALRMGASGGVGAAPGERVAAMVRLSRQVAHDDVVICKLIGAACIGLATKTAGELADHRVVNDAGRQAMLREFRDFDQRARLDAPEVIVHERQGVLTALRAGDAGYLTGTGAEKLDQPGRDTVAGEVERALQQLERVWKASNGLAEARKIESQVTNPVARTFVSALVKGREQIEKAKADVRSALVKLETK